MRAYRMIVRLYGDRKGGDLHGERRREQGAGEMNAIEKEEKKWKVQHNRHNQMLVATNKRRIRK